MKKLLQSIGIAAGLCAIGPLMVIAFDFTARINPRGPVYLFDGLALVSFVWLTYTQIGNPNGKRQ